MIVYTTAMSSSLCRKDSRKTQRYTCCASLYAPGLLRIKKPEGVDSLICELY